MHGPTSLPAQNFMQVCFILFFCIRFLGEQMFQSFVAH